MCFWAKTLKQKISSLVPDPGRKSNWVDPASFINFVADSVLNNFQKDFERVRHQADCFVV